jgi:hypothetical protein
VAEGPTTALDLQKTPDNDLRGQGAQMVLTSKMTYIALSQTCLWVAKDFNILFYSTGQYGLSHL